MSFRTIHQINSECDVLIERIGTDHVIVRFVEKDPELLNPTDIAIEGDFTHVMEAVSSAALVLANIEELLRKEPS